MRWTIFNLTAVPDAKFRSRPFCAIEMNVNAKSLFLQVLYTHRINLIDCTLSALFWYYSWLWAISQADVALDVNREHLPSENSCCCKTSEGAAGFSSNQSSAAQNENALCLQFFLPGILQMNPGQIHIHNCIVLGQRESEIN